ncbi:unnamed protein product, partial [Pylaiella littoralis]
DSWKKRLEGRDTRKMSDQFVTFFRNLETIGGLVRFFRRSKEWVHYTVHGLDTDLVSREAFRNTSAVSSQSGLPSLTISVKVFSSLVPALLANNLRIEVWEQKPGSNTRWTKRLSASPGNVEAIMADISSGEGEGQHGEDAASGAAVMMSTYATGSGDVGVAYVNTAFRNLGLLEFQLADLEGVVVQIGARECIMEEQMPSQQMVEEVMARCNVLCTTKSLKNFKGSKEGVVKDLAALVRVDGVVGEGDGAATAALRGASMAGGETAETHHVVAARGMALALTALQGLFQHLALLEDSSNKGTFSLTIDELRKYMQYDAAASKAMGVFPSPSRFQLAAALGHGDAGGLDFSLFSILNKTRTSMGSRLLRRWLQHPLVDVQEINLRQSMIETICSEKALMDTLQKGSGMLRGLPDLDKIMQRFLRTPIRATLATLLGVYRAVMRLSSIAGALDDAIEGSDEDGNDRESGPLLLRKRIISPLQKVVSDLSKFQSLCEEVIDLDHLQESAGKQVRVRPQFHTELQRLGQELSHASRDMMDVVEDVEKDSKAPAGRIKLEFNAVHSNHLRVTKKDQALVGKCKAALTLSVQKAGVLFTTDKLRSIDARATRLKEQYADVQSQIVLQALTVAGTYAPVLSSAAKIVAEMDVLLSLSVCVHDWDWVRPRLLPLGKQIIDIKELRHPSVEAARGSGLFIPNDIEMGNDSRLAIVTGPNMAGKSTFIRSVGIACLLAQIGSFVPASKATMAVTDRICARVGASDNQLRGVSTFMAEMLETTAILKKANRQSLVIVDELGRGTSTRDGFGIAWAVADRLRSSGALCLFATHFHELTTIEQEMGGKGVQNLHVTAEADPASNKLTMLYKVTQGSCDRSFGIHVARIANFPAHVVSEAESLATALENGEPL